MNKGKTLLKGAPASTGKATGKVRIILDPSECEKMKKGDILVTEMTNPRFTPAIMKAKAIVTNVGGLLCHAAIVAREFKIPCIVNAVKATTVLKDGQEIIVDAIKGEIYEEK